MKMKRILSVILLMLALAAPVMAAEKMRLVTMDLKANGVSDSVKKTVSDLIRSEMVDTGRFTVVERAQMDAILQEQGLQMTGCTDNSCAIEIGKLVSANKVLLGEINRLDNAYIITVRIVDVSKGVAEYSTSEKAGNINTVDQAIKTLVGKLTLRMTGKRPIEDYEKPAGYYWRGIVPGWAQIYSGHPVKGWSIAGISLASAGFAGWAFYDYFDKKREYDDLGSGASADEYKSKYDAKKDAALVANIGFYVFLGIYAINWIDVLFFNKFIPEHTLQLDDSPKYFFAVNTQKRLPDIKEKSWEMSINMRF